MNHSKQNKNETIFNIYFNLIACNKDFSIEEKQISSHSISDFRSQASFDHLNPTLNIIFSGITNRDIDWYGEIPDSQQELMEFLRMNSSEFFDWTNAVSNLHQILLDNPESNEHLISHINNFFQGNFSNIEGEPDALVTGATPCTDIYNASVGAAAVALAACSAGTAGLGILFCAAAYGAALYVAELSWCNCMNQYQSFEGC